MNYFISDLHLDHKNVIKYDNRPFADCGEMLNTLVENWNRVVTPKDSVYILGDLTWKNSTGLSFLQQVMGRKFLILGNHDKPTEEMRAYFEWVKEYAVINDGQTEIVLCHYPLAGWYNQFRGAVHLYGHVHNNRDYVAYQRYFGICDEMEIPHECYNVGCMMPYMDYTPQTLAQIRKKAGGISE